MQSTKITSTKKLRAEYIQGMTATILSRIFYILICSVRIWKLNYTAA